MCIGTETIHFVTLYTKKDLKFSMCNHVNLRHDADNHFGNNCNGLK